MISLLEKLAMLVAYTLAAIVSLIILLIICWFVYIVFFSGAELKSIKRKLNKIENTEVIKIWGHGDLKLKGINARIKIKNKGEMVLYGLSKDAFHYPERVSIDEIGGYSFESFSCSCDPDNAVTFEIATGKPCATKGIAGGIDIGTDAPIGKMTGLRFNEPEDVIRNYDRVYAVIDSLAKLPEPLHFVSGPSEEFLFILRKRTNDIDPFFELTGNENAFDYAEKLPWKCRQCAEGGPL